MPICEGHVWMGQYIPKFSSKKGASDQNNFTIDSARDRTKAKSKHKCDVQQNFSNRVLHRPEKIGRKECK